MQNKEERMYKCSHLKVNKENESFTAIEWRGKTVYYYVFNEKDLLKYEIPVEEFIEMMQEDM